MWTLALVNKCNDAIWATVWRYKQSNLELPWLLRTLLSVLLLPDVWHSSGTFNTVKVRGAKAFSTKGIFPPKVLGTLSARYQVRVLKSEMKQVAGPPGRAAVVAAIKLAISYKLLWSFVFLSPCLSIFSFFHTFVALWKHFISTNFANIFV